MTRSRIPNDDEHEVMRKNIQDRFKSMFSGNSEPLSNMSIHEVETLKARVDELEEKLAQQGTVTLKMTTFEAANVSDNLPLPPKQVAGTQKTSSQKFASNALRISQIGFPASIIAASFYLYLALQFGAWQLYAWSVDIWILALVVLIDIILVRRGHTTRAMWLVLVAIQVTFIGAVALIEGLGLLLGVSITILVTIIAGQTLSAKEASRAIILGAVSGVAAILLDLFLPAYRLPEPELVRVFLPGILGIVILAFGLVTIRQFRDYSLRTKMSIVFTITVVSMLGIVAFLTNRGLSISLTENIGSNLAALANSKAIEISLTVDRESDLLKSLALNKDIQGAAASANEVNSLSQAEIARLDQQWKSADAADNNADPLVGDVLHDRVSTELRRFQKEFSQHVEVFLTDQQGVNIAATNRTSDYYQADEEWWQVAYQEGLFIGQPEYDESSKTIAINMATTVRDTGSGKIIGILRTTVNFSTLSESLIAGRFGQTGHTDMYLPNGQELTLVTLEDGSIGLVMKDAGLDINLLARSTEPYMEVSHNGVPTLASQAMVSVLGDVEEDKTAISNLNWRVVTIQDQAEALLPVAVQSRNFLLLAIALSIATALAAVGLAQLLVGPLTRLTVVANQIAEGNLSVQAQVETGDETGTLAATFNNMTSQLRNLFGSLEQRVQDRTHDLELASEVGRTITENVANLDELLKAAVEMIRARFELYYTQIYLTDPIGRSIILRAGTGEVGEKLFQRGHRLLIGSGSLNGRAAVEKKPVIVADTMQSANFMPNALLPNTRSEMAVPLIAGGQVIGVLDMQSEQPGALNETNLPAFEALAGQLAVAIQNAALFTQAEEARLEVEAQVRHLSEQGWQDFLNAIERGQKIGFAFDENNVASLKEEDLVPMPTESALSAPINVTGAKVGMIQIANEPDRNWTSSETEILQATANQLGQHIEGLRLLAQAEQYRAEAEQAVRRLTREGWGAYQHTRGELASGYVFDLNEVQRLSGNGSDNSSRTFKQALVVHDETIGVLAVDHESNSEESAEIIAAVAEQLSAHIENLRLSEQNEKRAHEMETVSELSVTTSTVLDPDKLLQLVVDLTKERFGLYHVHVYLADEAWETLLIAAGAGEIGRQMVTDGWNIPINHEQSIVASAARNRRSVIANDIVRDKHSSFLSNRLLPDTRSEMAIPMIVGEKLLGVFDVQADTANYFSEEDANIYTTLSAQVGVALQNARLYVKQAATVTQLRELDRLKSSFLANMSHELRTPLNSILGFTDVMLEGIDGQLTQHMDNDLRLVQKNGQHLLHLINDVLDMAKIEAGRMNLNPEVFKVHEVLHEVTSITSTLATEKNLPLFIEDRSDREAEIYADRTRLRQVMINLVNNSIKFTDKGQITLSVSPMDGARMLITVKDTGIGIPPENLETIFQEFTQVDSSSTRKTGGTGLGLPISRRLVEMHGGRVWAESTGNPGEGSTFFVELPLEARITEVIEKQVK